MVDIGQALRDFYSYQREKSILQERIVQLEALIDQLQRKINDPSMYPSQGVMSINVLGRGAGRHADPTSVAERVHHANTYKWQEALGRADDDLIEARQRICEIDEQISYIQIALLRLDADEVKLIELRYRDRWDLQRIAGECSLHESTVSKSLSRIRESLRMGIEKRQCGAKIQVNAM
jgi:hypothetical protein